MLIRIFSNCSYNVKNVLFQTYCTHFYCTQLWWTYSQEALRKVRVAFNNSFRHPWALIVTAVLVPCLLSAILMILILYVGNIYTVLIAEFKTVIIV